MKEMISAIRAIWHTFETGDKLDHRGEFYTHTLMAPFFNPGPNPHGTPPIFLAGVGPIMTRVAGEVADGYFLHPFHTEEFLAETTMPSLTTGIEGSGRPRSEFEISAQVIVVSGKDDAAIKQAKRGAKAQISFYGSTPAYRGVLESVGEGELQTELNRLTKQGGWADMPALINDDLLEQIALVGPVEEIPEKLRQRYGTSVDRVSLVPYGIDAQEIADLIPAIREI